MVGRNAAAEYTAYVLYLSQRNKNCQRFVEEAHGAGPTSHGPTAEYKGDNKQLFRRDPIK